MNVSIPDEFRKLIASLTGLECWEVSCGGAAGSTFQLALGRKVPLPPPAMSTRHADEFPQFEGEASLLVWCAWRLDGLDCPVTSWDDTKEAVEAGLANLVGTRIHSVEFTPPAWDLDIVFSNSLCLRVFCDHVPGDPSFDGNWDVRTPDIAIAVGPGAQYRVEERASSRQS